MFMEFMNILTGIFWFILGLLILAWVIAMIVYYV